MLSSSLINKNSFNIAVRKLIIKMTQSASMTLNLIASDIVQFTSCFDLKRLFPIDIFISIQHFGKEVRFARFLFPGRCPTELVPFPLAPSFRSDSDNLFFPLCISCGRGLCSPNV